jgi:hypothetical protein
MDDQQKKCTACKWCCTHHQIPILPDKNSLELYWLRGDDLVYLIHERQWHIVINQKCQYLGKDGCTIYGTGKRGQLCRTYMCEHRDKSVKQFSKQQIEATREILDKMFKKEN